MCFSSPIRSMAFCGRSTALTSTLLALAPFGLLAAGLGGAFLTGRALRPVREIAGTAARLGASDLSERLPVSGRDEFSELSSSFNAMLARLEEAFDRQRRFTADASHELRTPLSIIKANTSLALEHPWPEDRYREFLAAIDTAAGRQSRIVEELLFLARADAGGLARDVGPVCLIEALEEAAEAVSRPDRPCIRLESIDPALMVPGSGSELTRLFTNLLENAVRHTPYAGDGHGVCDGRCDERHRHGDGYRRRHRAGAPAAPRRAVLPGRCSSIRRHGRHRSGPGDLPEHHRGPRRPDDNREQGRRRHGGSNPTASLSAADVTVVGEPCDFPAVLGANNAYDWITSNGFEPAGPPREVWEGQDKRPMVITVLFQDKAQSE